MGKRKNLDMTNGPFLKKIFIFAIPLVFTGLLQLLYNSADTAIVGKFAGSEALAAVGSTGSLINLIINVFMGMSMGAGVMAARHIGAGDEKRVSKCVHTAIPLGLISGIIVAVIGFFFSESMLRLMQVPEEVIGLSSVYLKIYFMGAPGSIVYNFGASILRASGDTKRPLYILAVSGIINVILNLILVIPFKLSVAGVAIATIVSQYITAIVVIIHMLKTGSVIRLNFKKIRFDKRELICIIRIGIPAGLQNSLFSISNVLIQSAVNSFGDIAMAGIAAGSQFDGYIYTCTNAIAQTAMTFTSQNIGAVKYKNVGKVYRYCFAITTIVAVIMSAFGYFFREQVVWIFADNPDVIAIGAERLALVIPFYVFCSLQDVTASQIRGMGKSLEPMIISLVGVCGVRLMWIFVILPDNYSLIDLYWAYPISWAIAFFALFALYLILKARMIKKDKQ
ncbi:MAG: MATE family efflux transporter [Clostridia bacterium]|nr:MATE family efflux transporter [Clostridia bacterium]